MTTNGTVSGNWTAVCRVEDIPRRGARRVARKGAVAVAVFRTSDDRVFALLDRCPHKGGPLSQGIVSGDGVACPLHNWIIGLADGCARGADEGCTPRFAVRVEAGVVSLDETELATVGLELPPAVRCGGPLAPSMADRMTEPVGGPMVLARPHTAPAA
jgi:nitrite reductase (NADH) small subunit